MILFFTLLCEHRLTLPPNAPRSHDSTLCRMFAAYFTNTLIFIFGAVRMSRPFKGHALI